MKKLAADLGQQNIPEPLVQQLLPVQTLYLRVGAGEKTVEIWNDSNNNFFVIEGDFGDGVWGLEDLTVAHEARDLSDAKGYVNAYYTITVDDGSLSAGLNTRRLIKKSERRS